MKQNQVNPKQLEELREKAKAIREKNEKTIESIPEKYRHFIETLSKTSRVSNKILQLTPELTELGYFATERGTFLKVDQPYLTVAGKRANLVDWTEEKQYRFSIENEIVLIKDQPFIKSVVTVLDESGNAIRKGTSTVPVNIGGSGVDSTNPYENAETSAVGRALTFIGMGHQMPDIASYEEVLNALRRQAEAPDAASAVEDDPVDDCYLVNAFEVSDQNRKAGKVQLVDPEGEVHSVFIWGKVFENFTKEVQPGSRVRVKTDIIKTTSGEDAQRLIDYEVVA